MELNKEKFISALMKKQDMTQTKNTRKLLNLATKTSQFSEEDLEFIAQLKSSDFLQAYKEIHTEQNEILDDMVMYEFAKEDVLSSPDYDEDEIY